MKIHDLSNLQETSSVVTLSQETGVDSVEWSVDGQLLAVCTSSGSLNVFVSNMQTLAAVCGNRIAILSSLMEASVYTYTPDKVGISNLQNRFRIILPAFAGETEADPGRSRDRTDVFSGEPVPFSGGNEQQSLVLRFDAAAARLR